MKELLLSVLNISAADITVPFIISQIIGLITTVTAVVSVQFKSMKLILIFELLSNLLVASTYILLGGISGSYICLVASVQTVVSYIYAKKKKEVPGFITAIFICAYIAITVFTFKTPIDILPGICAVTFALAVVQTKSSGYRVFMATNSFLWIVYDLVVKAYTMIITHGLLLGSIIIAMARYDIKKQNGNKKEI